MIQSIGDGVISVDRSGCMVLINPVAELLTGYSNMQAWQQPLREIPTLVDAETGVAIDSQAMLCPKSAEPVRMQQGTVLIARDGIRRDVHASVAPILNGMGELNGAMLTFQDVTSLRAAQREVEFSASHDALTRLPNRWEFERRLRSTIEQVRVTGQEAALCMIDLDHFKAVNDTAGHQAGDALLCAVSGLLSRQIRRSDMVGRLGGDEFAIILFDCSLKEAEALLSEIRSSIAALKFKWGDRLFRISASIGITALTTFSDLAALMHRADLSCYSAKHGGRDQVRLYTPEMELRSLDSNGFSLLS